MDEWQEHWPIGLREAAGAGLPYSRATPYGKGNGCVPDRSRISHERFQSQAACGTLANARALAAGAEMPGLNVKRLAKPR